MSSCRFNSWIYCNQISIPKWYDYEFITKQMKWILTKFQFQNGTIMRSKGNHVRWRDSIFQFQNGTIMRKIAIAQFKHDHENFNSKMVRL